MTERNYDLLRNAKIVLLNKLRTPLITDIEHRGVLYFSGSIKDDEKIRRNNLYVHTRLTYVKDFLVKELL